MNSSLNANIQALSLPIDSLVGPIVPPTILNHRSSDIAKKVEKHFYVQLENMYSAIQHTPRTNYILIHTDMSTNSKNSNKMYKNVLYIHVSGKYNLHHSGSTSCVVPHIINKIVSTIFLPMINRNNNNPCITNTPTQGAVVNLSKAQLTPAMITLLNKGLNFCPTPGEPDISNLKKDIDKFHVSLRRKLFFSRIVDSNTQLANSTITSQLSTTVLDNDDAFQHQKFKNPSKWCPPGPIQLESMIVLNETDLNKLTPRAPANQNLSAEEKIALADLKNNDEIVIKPADKGSAVVIQNKEDYIQEGLRQLNDQNYYIEVNTDLTTEHNSHIHHLIETLEDEGEIHPKCAQYLRNEQPRTPQLYLLPKIHKNKQPVPGRPIVSANNSPTERISQLADHFLQPLVCKTASFVKDTTDFINKIESVSNVSPGTILCTIDVTSLYTNIPNQEGITACQKALDIHRPGPQKPSNINILKLLQYVLTKNNFDFNDRHYLQVGGTAMGTKVAPSFANLFMADFEEKWVYNHHTQPSLWLRYIDDIFIIWEHGMPELDKLLAHLNSCHPTIKFTAEHSLNSVNFLDTTVHLTSDNTLYTDLYCKPTDSHNYLRYDSAHPSHCKTSLPFSQLLRVRRICSHIEDYDKNATMMCKHFFRRKYPPDLIEKAVIDVRRKDRNEILKPKSLNSTQATNSPDLFLISTFCPVDNPLRSIVQNNWPLLGRTNTTESLHSSRIIFGHRRNKNLRDILVHSKLGMPATNTRMHKDDPVNPLNKCKTKKCNYCPLIDRSGIIISTTTKRKYQARKHISCKSHNLIYCITCTVCNKQYVGQTKNRLMDRFGSHFWNIKKKNLTDPIGRHFATKGHNGQLKLKIHIVDFIIAPSKSKPGQQLRNSLEQKWIHRLQTVQPHGINLAD